MWAFPSAVPSAVSKSGLFPQLCGYCGDLGPKSGKLGHKSGDFSSAVLSLWRFGAKKVGIWGIKVGISGVKVEIWGINVGFSLSCAVTVVIWGGKGGNWGKKGGIWGAKWEFSLRCADTVGIWGQKGGIWGQRALISFSCAIVVLFWGIRVGF